MHGQQNTPSCLHLKYISSLVSERHFLRTGVNAYPWQESDLFDEPSRAPILHLFFGATNNVSVKQINDVE